MWFVPPSFSKKSQKKIQKHNWSAVKGMPNKAGGDITLTFEPRKKIFKEKMLGSRKAEKNC